MTIKGVQCRQRELHPDGGLWEPVWKYISVISPEGISDIRSVCYTRTIDFWLGQRGSKPGRRLGEQGDSWMNIFLENYFKSVMLVHRIKSKYERICSEK